MKMNRTKAASALFVITLILGSSLRSAEPTPVTSGEARLPSGLVARCEYHFDRNSLRQSLRAVDSLIALTSSGNLLRFELPAVRLTRERVGAEQVACLGRGDRDEVLAGLSDGRVCRVDPLTLDLKEVAKLPSKPQWVGQRVREGRSGILGVVEASKKVTEEGETWDAPYSVVHDLAAGKTFAFEKQATTFLLDREGRLWLGGDKGEWGGWCGRLDLRTGTPLELKKTGKDIPDNVNQWPGVYGFVQLRDGQVWAFGGTSHMGMHHGFISRVDRDQRESLADFKPPREQGQKRDPDRPLAPISHVVEEDDGGLFVLSYSEIFRTDAGLKVWKKAHDMELNYRPGRPDAVGSYPAVTAVHALGQGKGGLLFATIGDGYVSLDGAKEARHAVAWQLGASSVNRVENTEEGALVFGGYSELNPWQFRDGGWRMADLAPPFKPAADPDGPGPAVERPDAVWGENTVLVGPRGTVFTVSATGWLPGTRTTARWRDGKPQVLGQERSWQNTHAVFVTPDGELWSAWYGDLRRFIEGRWRDVAKLPGADPKGPRAEQDVGEKDVRVVGLGLQIGYGLKTVGTAGPPWVVLDGSEGHLLRLAYGAGAKDPALTLLGVSEGGKELPVRDALPWSDGVLLLATDAGLRTYRPDTGLVARAELPEPPRAVRVLARDGSGRHWLAGEGLWLVEPGGKALHDLAPLASIGHGPVSALAPDPSHHTGVIAALGDRGVAFVRAGR